MDREINIDNSRLKFRAWIISEKRMKYFGLYDSSGTYCYDVSHGDDCHTMQFTGLKDKNGKEIYESDIIKSDYGNSFVGTVKYEPQAAQYWIIIPTKDERKTKYMELHRSEIYGDGDGIKLLSHEIIGNIFQNPELLK